MDLLSLTPLLPEIALAFMALCLLLTTAFMKESNAETITGLAIISLGTVAFMAMGAMWAAGIDMPTLNGSFVATPFSVFIKVIVLLAACFSLLMAPQYMETQNMQRGEFPVLVMFACLGMMLMVSAGDLLVLYVGLELQSLALYVLAAFRRDATRSSEAGLKYFVLGALSSGLLLYGISLVYGFSGSIAFSKIAATLAGDGDKPAMLVGLFFMLAALAFKVSAAPFHMWTPDVYEGAPTPVTAFFSAVPKVAAVGLLLRLLYDPFLALSSSWQPVIVTLSLASMIVGAFGAIGQTNIKRLLAYSSIGHVGFILMGVATARLDGIEAALTYLAFYVIMSLATFAVVLMMRRDGQMVERIDDLAGAARTHPGLAFAMAVLMFSMAGIPPMVGFFTKFMVLMAAIQNGLLWLAIAGALASVVGAYYYIRIVKVMYFDEPAGAFDQPFEGMLASSLVVGSVLTLTGLIILSPVALLASVAAQSLLAP